MSWGVKTTCLEAPGSGVSIGGVGSLRVKSIKHLYVLHQRKRPPTLDRCGNFPKHQGWECLPPSPAEPWNHAGHSNRDLYIPNRFKSPTTFPKGHFNHPKKYKQLARMVNFQDEGIFFSSRGCFHFSGVTSCEKIKEWDSHHPWWCRVSAINSWMGSGILIFLLNPNRSFDLQLYPENVGQ